MGDKDDLLGIQFWKERMNPSLELACAGFDTGGGMDRGNEDGVSEGDEGLINAFEAGGRDLHAAEATAEKTVMEDDGWHGVDNYR
jgi:hypothetical protein